MSDVLKDRTGQRFGRLVILERAENEKSRTRWLCKCYCGNEKIVKTSQLRKGHVTSCGCLKSAHCHRAKLTEVDIPRILEMLARGESYHHIASFFPVQHQAIKCIDKGRTWKHISYLWHNGQHQHLAALLDA